MTGQVVAMIVVVLAVLPVGWLVRREALRARARRDLDALFAELTRSIAAAAIVIGDALMPALIEAAQAFADLGEQWLKDETS